MLFVFPRFVKEMFCFICWRLINFFYVFSVYVLLNLFLLLWNVLFCFYWWIFCQCFLTFTSLIYSFLTFTWFIVFTLFLPVVCFPWFFVATSDVSFYEKFHLHLFLISFVCLCSFLICSSSLISNLALVFLFLIGFFIRMLSLSLTTCVPA